MKNRVLKIIFIIFVTLVLFKLNDLLIGRFIKKSDPSDPANREAIYKLPEFSVRVKLNSAGMRGKEYPPQRNENSTRILVIGDSFSFGWGVDLEKSWVYLLEKNLNENAETNKYEIINTSVPGNTPSDYVELAEKYIPKYRPDYVVVGLVEGNDFSQTVLNTEKSNKILTDYGINKKGMYLNRIDKNPPFQFISNSLKETFPNFYYLFSIKKTTDVRKNFKDQMKEIIFDFDDEDFRIMENNTAPTIRKLFLEGGINPPLFFWSIRVPDFYLKTLNEESNDYKNASLRLSEIIKEIKETANANNSKLLLLDIPNGIYVSDFHVKNYSDMGFETRQNMLTSKLPVKAVADIAEKEKLEFIESLSLFRKICSDKCFWKYDDHLTPYGNMVLTEKITEYLKKEFSLKNAR